VDEAGRGWFEGRGGIGGFDGGARGDGDADEDEDGDEDEDEDGGRI
jgi:hypothetical protein